MCLLTSDSPPPSVDFMGTDSIREGEFHGYESCVKGLIAASSSTFVSEFFQETQNPCRVGNFRYYYVLTMAWL